MKSHAGQFEKITAVENLRKAMFLAARGKHERGSVRLFLENADTELAGLQAELADGSWRPGVGIQFRIMDPKPRNIYCAPFRDRVVHHAVCDVLEPIWEARFSEDSYACRKEKGMHLAVRRSRELARRHGWFCKLDIRRYFDSVDHECLLGLLLPMFREKSLKQLLELLIRQTFPEGTRSGKGLPIGNLTSQWFANLYLDGLDHWSKEVLKAPGYIRYMDDMVLFADSKAEAWQLHDGVEEWVTRMRRLELKKERTVVAPVSEGVPFLGLRVFTQTWRLQRGRFLRTRRKFRSREKRYLTGEIDAVQLHASAMAADGVGRWFGFKNILKQTVEV
jgi:hypothetical protein